MDFTFDLLQGAGIAAAIGIRPFLPVLLTAALAAADLGIDFEGTDFAFLEQWGFLAGALVLLVVVDFAGRRGALERGWPVLALGALSVVLGALEAAGSLADRDHPVVPGVVVGALCAALGAYVAWQLLARVRRRLDSEAAAYLPLYGEGAAVASCALSILFPPLAVVVVGGLLWLLFAGRRRESEKYAGLRILR